ncbi:phosphotransferase family protein [Labrys okinawensis]|nr:phosphotransferase [Labrys okinawensis]
MSMFEEERARAEAHVRQLPGWAARTITTEPAIPVLASPSWRGVDGSPWRVRDKASGESLFVKLMHPDAAFYIDIACAFQAARRASELGIGPRVFLAEENTGVLVMEDLDAGWRTATLERLLDQDIVDRVLAARGRFQESAALSRTSSVFDEIERFHRDARAAKGQLPADADWLLAELRYAGQVMASGRRAPVPSHGDGNVSNIMISETGEIRLVDWDRAGNADPLEDMGSFLAEAFDQEPEARDAFARTQGGFDEAAYNRAWLYGVADDLRWGLIGTLVAARSPRNTLEFHKFASWRLVRCRMAVHSPRFGEALRRV